MSIVTVTIGRLRTCFGSKLAFYQIRDENRAKFKISYLCGPRVPKTARYDASITESTDTIHHQDYTHALMCQNSSFQESVTLHAAAFLFYALVFKIFLCCWRLMYVFIFLIKFG